MSEEYDIEREGVWIRGKKWQKDMFGLTDKLYHCDPDTRKQEELSISSLNKEELENYVRYAERINQLEKYKSRREQTKSHDKLFIAIFVLIFIIGIFFPPAFVILFIVAFLARFSFK